METIFSGQECPSRADASCPAAINALRTSVISCRLDEGLTFLWGNASFFKGIHYPAQEYHRLYADLRQYYAGYPEDFERIRRALSQAREENEFQIDLTVRLPRKEGGFFWAQLSGSVFEDRDADGLLFQGEFADVNAFVSEAEELDRLYRQRQQYFNWMLDTYIGNVYISDMDTYELLYLNQNSYKTLGKSASQVLGRKCYEVIQGRTAPCPFCTNDKLREDADYDWEFDNPLLQKTFMIKNREICWDGRRARIELSHDGQSPEYKLAKKDQELNAIIRAIPGGFARVDAQDMRTVLWYGGDFLNLIGYTKEEFECELHSECTYVHPDDIERAAKIMASSRETGKKTVVEGRIITRDGTIKILTMTYTYVSAEDSWDGIASFYSAGIDVTRERAEQDRQRRALEDAYQAARVANDAKTNFLSSMSHDIRTPMNAIIGFTNIALHQDSVPEMHNCLKKIEESSDHLLSLLNDVLDLSRIESGKVEFSPVPTNITAVTDSVIEIVKGMLLNRELNFEVHREPLQNPYVMTEPVRIREILVNILNNAVKFTKDGGTIRFDAGGRPGVDAQHIVICYRIKDTGIGMSEDFQKKIFDEFAQEENGARTQYKGTGLGMPISKKYIELMGGTITVDSRKGVGTTFTVEIPMELTNAEKVEKTKPLVQHNDLKGIKVLLAEDNDLNAELATMLLEDLGMTVTRAADGQEVVDLFAEYPAGTYDIILMDIMMPKMDGHQVAKAIRAMYADRPDAEEIPIIALSANAFSEDVQASLDAGMNGHVSKPLNMEEVTKVIERNLNRP